MNTQVTKLGGDMKGVQIGLRPDLNSVQIAKAEQVTEHLSQIVLCGYEEGRLTRIGLERHESRDGGRVMMIIGVFVLNDELQRFEVA